MLTKEELEASFSELEKLSIDEQIKEIDQIINSLEESLK